MLTPRFTLTQDENHITINIRSPYAKISETEIEVLDNELHFYSKPYHLRLYLPGDVMEEGMMSNYHSTEGSFEIRLLKKVPGTRFYDLEMITKLLTPPGTWKVSKAVTELDDDDDDAPDSGISPDGENDLTNIPENFDWRLPQTAVGDEEAPDVGGLDGLSPHRYGFALQQHGVFQGLTEELRLLLDIKDVDKLTSENVTAAREDLELAEFNEDHYLADLFDDEEIQRVIDFVPWWMSSDPGHEYNEDELDIMKELPRQHLRVAPERLVFTWNTLVELLFGYAYDNRITMGVSTVESAWTIAKLSPSLSCTDSFSTPKAALRGCIRRSLCYPLYRNFHLSLSVLEDVKKILSLGRWAVLKCLLTIRKLFGSSQENRYILNDLYIISYCVWIQNVEEKDVNKFAEEIAGLSFEKDELDLDLVITEAAAEMVLREQNGVLVADNLSNLENDFAALAVDSDDDE